MDPDSKSRRSAPTYLLERHRDLLRVRALQDRQHRRGHAHLRAVLRQLSQQAQHPQQVAEYGRLSLVRLLLLTADLLLLSVALLLPSFRVLFLVLLLLLHFLVLRPTLALFYLLPVSLRFRSEIVENHVQPPGAVRKREVPREVRRILIRWVLDAMILRLRPRQIRRSVGQLPGDRYHRLEWKSQQRFGQARQIPDGRAVARRRRSSGHVAGGLRAVVQGALRARLPRWLAELAGVPVDRVRMRRDIGRRKW